MFFVCSCVFSLAPHLALPPFRLRLEDTHGMKPSIHRTMNWYKHADTFSTCKCITTSGHILVAQPILNTFEAPTTLHFGTFNDVCFVDTIYLFEAMVPCFTCFITKKKASRAFATRIQDTCIWILISDVMGLVECNECTCAINRQEFDEIQKDFLYLLLYSQ